MVMQQRSSTTEGEENNDNNNNNFNNNNNNNDEMNNKKKKKKKKEKNEQEKLNLPPRLRDSKIIVLADSIKKMRQRRYDLINLLRSLRLALTKESNGIGDIGDRDPLADLTPEARRRLPWFFEKTRIPYARWQKYDMTCLGVDICDEMFDFYDTDKDGLLHFNDFRGYLANSGRLGMEMAEIAHTKEAWQAYMSDLYDCDPKTGYLTKVGFQRYRELVEGKNLYGTQAVIVDNNKDDNNKNNMEKGAAGGGGGGGANSKIITLENDCLRANISLLPKKLKLYQWDMLKNSFDLFDKIQHTKDKKCKGILNVEFFQLLLSRSGEDVTSDYITEMMYHAALIAKLKNEIQKNFYERNKLTRDKPVPDPSVREIQSKQNFIGWFFSGRPKLMDVSDLKKKCIQSKAWSLKFMTNTMTVIPFYLENWMNVINRGLVNKLTFLTRKNDVGHVDIIGELGAQEKVTQGATINIQYKAYPSEKSARKFMSMPNSAGFMVSVDFAERETCKRRNLIKCMEKMKETIERHYGETLRSILKLHSWKIFECKNDIDKTKVIRIAFFFKQEMHIDTRLKQYKLGFLFRDLLNEMKIKIDLSYNTNILAEDEHAVLGDLAGRMEASLTYGKGIAAIILQELSGSLDDIHREAEMEIMAQSGGERAAIERAYQTHPDIEYRYLRETFKYHYTDTLPYDEDVKGYEYKSRSIYGNSYQHLVNFDIYNKSKNMLKNLVKLLGGSKNITMEWKFPSITKLLFENAWVSQLIPKWLLIGHFTNPGVCVEGLNIMVDKIKTDLLSMIDEIDEYEYQKRKEEDEEIERKRKNVSGENEKLAELEQQKLKLEADRQKKALEEKLKKLGVDESEITDMYRNHDTTSRKAILKQAKVDQIEEYKTLLSFYKAFFDAITGIHSLNMCSGKNKIYAQFVGLDVVDFIMPDPQSLKYFRELEVREAKEQARKAYLESL